MQNSCYEAEELISGPMVLAFLLNISGIWSRYQMGRVGEAMFNVWHTSFSTWVFPAYTILTE